MLKLQLDLGDCWRTVSLTPGQYVNADRTAWTHWLRVPRDLKPHQVAQALREQMSGTNCAHSWDCCGCWSRGVQVSWQGRRMRVQVRAWQNY